MSRDLLQKSVALAAVVMMLALPADASALLPLGERVPPARLVDPDGRSLDIGALRGKPALIFYEDRGSAEQNAPLKFELAELARDPGRRAAVAALGVADVSAYAGWLLRGFARKEVRRHAREAGVPVYCDWDGSFRRAYRLRRGLSNVMLLDRDGRVLFAAAGPLRPDQRARLRELLEAEVSRR
jgi:hypothetical protein